MKKTEKKIETKNYVLLVIIIIITILLTLYAKNWYNATKEYNSQNPSILAVVNEINEDEIPNYTLENPKFILYASSGENQNIKQFEKELKQYIIDNNLTKTVLYINTDNTSNPNLQETLKTYATKNTTQRIDINTTSMYIFENKKITHVIKNIDQLSLKQIDKLLKKYEMIENE